MKRLAELYGVVTTPEEAQKVYRTNLIVTRSGTPHYGERQLYMSWWMAKTVVFAHYTRIQKLLYFGGLAWLILTFVAGGIFLAQHDDDCRRDIFTNECIEP